jgi:SAM-dependent methyltransferase
MRSRVLVVGGATTGIGFDGLLADARVECTETDIAFGPRTQIICDAHVLPFADGVFDAVVCQAVLEHVLDPGQVVSEIHRVLVNDGLVYSEVPFMQQVHGGAQDVTRFTLLGHRRLFRYFDELASGVQGGPGMALAWSLWYFIRAATTTRIGRGVAMLTARLLFFWLPLLDVWLAGRPGASDAASGTFLLGRRRSQPLGDREILDSYRGAGGLTSAGC